jgi:hypothetical protein
MFREARRALTQRCGHGLDDDSLVAMLAEAVLSGGKERETGRSAYQVALTVCESCRHATQEGGGEPVAVDGATVAMAECDGQQVGRVDAPVPERATQSIPPRVRRAVLRRHHDRCAVPGCAHGAFVHVHHIELQSEGGTHDPERLVPLCSAHHRAVHDGRLVVSGTHSGGFSFSHADGHRYGAPQPDPPARRFSPRCSRFSHRWASASARHGRCSTRRALMWGPRWESRRPCAPCFSASYLPPSSRWRKQPTTWSLTMPVACMWA